MGKKDLQLIAKKEPNNSKFENWNAKETNATFHLLSFQNRDMDRFAVARQFNWRFEIALDFNWLFS